jgi:hypothetical protein
MLQYGFTILPTKLRKLMDYTLYGKGLDHSNRGMTFGKRALNL